MTKKEIKWDFSELFSGYNDPKLPMTMENLNKEADQFVEEYKGKIGIYNFEIEDLNNLLRKI